MSHEAKINYGAIAAVGVQDAKAAERQLEVPTATARIDRNLNALRVIVDMLDGRLTGYVARPAPPTEANQKGLRGAPATGLGGQLDDFAEIIESTQRRLSDLLERLEA